MPLPKEGGESRRIGAIGVVDGDAGTRLRPYDVYTQKLSDAHINALRSSRDTPAACR